MYGSALKLTVAPPVFPGVPWQSTSKAVIEPSFMPAIFTVPWTLGRLPPAVTSSSRSSMILTAAPARRPPSG